MNTGVYSILEVLGVILFASEGFFIKGMYLHHLINMFLMYIVWTLIPIIVLLFQGKFDMSLIKKLFKKESVILNALNLIRTPAILLAYNFIPIPLVITIKMLMPAFIITGDSIMKQEKLNVNEIIGMVASFVFVFLIYSDAIIKKIKTFDIKFIIGIIGAIVFTAINSYDVIELPKYIKNKDANEELFISSALVLLILIPIIGGILSFKPKLLGVLDGLKILKMFVVFIFTAYVGLLLVYLSADKLNPLLFSILEYSQLIFAFIVGYFVNNEKFGWLRIFWIVCLIASVTLMVSSKTKKSKDKIVLPIISASKSVNKL